ncbi:hypothetical protein SETIT_3G174100v2 [Setaria italica]|uniref:Uncharacterized protein n=1 Tax=Setaria italica TaxID=4555 RepID=A0A368QGF5_SETIT|nr:hypothetical protein SETIT_3G174100v2 [Setaria italica]
MAIGHIIAERIRICSRKHCRRPRSKRRRNNPKKETPTRFLKVGVGIPHGFIFARRVATAVGRRT